MGFGLSFGSSKSKSSTNSTMTKDEQSLQAQSTATQGTTATSQNQNTTSSGSSNTTQTGTQNTTGTTNSQQTGVTNLFSDGVLGGLESTVGTLLGNLFNGKTNPAVATAGAFDVDKYVQQTTQAAAAKQSDLLDGIRGGLADMIGGKLGNSSMGTLLANRAEADSDASLAGTTATAAAAGQQIRDAQATTALAGQAQDTNVLNTILTALKGGTQSTTAAATQGTTSGTTTSSDQSTNTSESSNTASTSLQTISQLVDALLSSSTKTVGTENTQTKGKNSSTGMSLSL